MGSSLSRGLTALRYNTAQLGPRYNDFIDQQLREAAVEGTAYMRQHAPWNDSTGNRKDRVPGAARAGLTAVASDSSLGFVEFNHSHKEIVFSHGVHYGIWLETKNHGKDQIIMPAVKAVAESMMAKLEDTLDRVAREH